MIRKHVKLSLFLCLTIGGLFCLPVFSAEPQQKKLAVLSFDTPDPTAIELPDGSGVYVFSTARGITITNSRNLFDWERVGRVFAKNVPDWAKEQIPNAKGIWAPDIVFVNGQYYLYYSVSTWGSQRSAIGLAVNKTLNPNSPDYFWEDRGIVLESAPQETPDYNAIDSAMFVDDNGKSYLFWGSFWDGIKAVEIDPQTGKPFKYRKHNNNNNLKIPDGYISVARRESADDTSIEAAYVVKRGGLYYLFTSRGGCCDGEKSTYHIVAGCSKLPLGPYVDRNGKPMTQGGGTLVLSGTERWKGTGHNGFFQTTNSKDNTKNDWLILAAYDANDPKKGRLTQIRPVTWDNSGWFTIGDVLEQPLEK
ncbi:MAG: arabinan endo-1,5-alpha-L-arabinosidase [Planctomycetaceae bacterium]|jgi:arabinan endo-1,5-alpha-L-arabinosidase|nr:arabinan endo-1,5-alpha-L-arabinosidase [Planctomycetaceae bacterium]